MRFGFAIGGFQPIFIRDGGMNFIAINRVLAGFHCIQILLKNEFESFGEMFMKMIILFCVS
jgi:hypothetical protein